MLRGYGGGREYIGDRGGQEGRGSRRLLLTTHCRHRCAHHTAASFADLAICVGHRWVLIQNDQADILGTHTAHVHPLTTYMHTASVHEDRVATGTTHITPRHTHTLRPHSATGAPPSSPRVPLSLPTPTAPSRQRQRPHTPPSPRASTSGQHVCPLSPRSSASRQRQRPAQAVQVPRLHQRHVL